MTKDTQSKFAAHEQKSISEVARRVLKHTCQLFIFKPKTGNRPHPNGCGVLLTIHDQHYCFSNAHVLCDGYLNKTSILVGDGKSLSLGGWYYHTSLPVSGRREDDPLDISLVRLLPECVDGLLKKGYSFLDGSAVLTGHIASKSDRLLISGYPGTKTELNVIEKQVGARPLMLITSPSIKDIPRLGFRKDRHFFARYSITNIKNLETGRGQRGPMPNGISGSGLWLLKDKPDGGIQPYLIGIQSEYLERHALLVSTRVDLFIDILRQKVDPTIVNHGVGVSIIDH